jgi:hypothetical protein
MTTKIYQSRINTIVKPYKQNKVNKKLKEELNRLIEKTNELVARNLNDIAAPDSAYDFNNQNLVNLGNLSANNSTTTTDTKLEVTDGDCTSKVNALDGSFGAFGTTTNSDAVFYSYGGSGPSLYFNVSENAIYPFSSGTTKLGKSAAKFGESYFTNMYLNNDSTSTFFSLTSDSTVCRFEAFGVANYTAFGNTSLDNMLLFTHNAAYQFWFSNDFFTTTGGSIGATSYPWANVFAVNGLYSGRLDVGSINGIDGNIQMCVRDQNIGYVTLFEKYVDSAAFNILARASRGSSGSPTAVLSGDSLSYWEIRSRVSSGAWSGSLGGWGFKANENHDASNQGVRFQVDVTEDGNTSPFTALIISNDGALTVGSTEKTGAKDLYAANFKQNATIGNTLKTKIITVTKNGGGGDVELSAPADSIAQDLDLGDYIPAYAQLMDCQIENTTAVSGGSITDLTCALGITSGGSEILTAGSVKTLGLIHEPATGGSRLISSSSSSRHAYGRFAIVGDTWDNLTAFAVEIKLSYIDNNML